MQEFKNVPKLNDILSTYSNAKVFLWDLDGTIMHTEILHATAILGMLKKPNSSASEITTTEIKEMEEQCIGLTDAQVYQKIKPYGVVDHLTEDEFLKLKNKTLIEKLIPETRAIDIFNSKVEGLMDEINEMGYKQAVVTSSEKEIAKVLLDHLNLSNKFDFIITREDTECNKPDPAPYLHAMSIANEKADEVVILEDSKAGLAAAKASGANVIQASWYFN